MRIATMVRGYMASPRPKDILYAPIDLAIDISEGLAERGHAVEYFGPEGTQLNTAIQTMGLRTLVDNQPDFVELLHKIDYQMHYVPAMWDMLLAKEMFRLAHEEKRFDLLHFHHPEAALPFASLYPDVPVVYTQHDPLYQYYCDMYSMYRTDSQYFVSISDSQRNPRPNLNYAATVYNGIKPEMFPYSKDHDDYLFISGRIVPEKGIREAVQVALETKQKLIIAGRLYPDNQPYFDEFIKPHLGDQIQFIDYIERDKIANYYKRAKAFLFPIQWEEPFGLAMIEAMACGTPVIAFRRGSVPEVIVDGKTGFIVDTIEEMAEAVGKIDTINRAACRKHVQMNFSVDKMVDNYEHVFEEVIERHANRDVTYS